MPKYRPSEGCQSVIHSTSPQEAICTLAQALKGPHFNWANSSAVEIRNSSLQSRDQAHRAECRSRMPRMMCQNGNSPCSSSSAVLEIVACQESGSHFVTRPASTMSITTSLSAFQIKKLGFFNPQATYGTTK